MTSIASNVLYGADSIAEEMFGSAEFAPRVYDLHRRSNLPFFKLGGTLCIRRSSLEEYIARQEGRAANSNRKPDEEAA